MSCLLPLSKPHSQIASWYKLLFFFLLLWSNSILSFLEFSLGVLQRGYFLWTLWNLFIRLQCPYIFCSFHSSPAFSWMDCINGTVGSAAGLPKGAKWGAGLGDFLGTGVRISGVGRAECSGTGAAVGRGRMWQQQETQKASLLEQQWKSSLEQAARNLKFACKALYLSFCLTGPVHQQNNLCLLLSCVLPGSAAGRSCSQDLYFLLCGAELLIVQQVYHSQGFRLSQSSFWFSKNEILDLVTFTDLLCLFSEKTSEFSTTLISQPSSIGAAALWSQKMHFRILTL